MIKAQLSSNDMIKTYVSLTKPGIIWGNLIAATGGFFLAAEGQPDLLLYVLTMIGTGAVVASGCVFNNIIDTDIDSLMDRTKERALVEGKISKKSAMVFGILLSIVGFGTLLYFTNFYALAFGVFGFYVYVVMYSIFYKRSSVHGTLIGSASGASPPVIGYLAASGQPDIAAVLLFLGFCAWQMPHSYAIALFRKEDYTNSSIPLLPLVKGLETTQFQVVTYIIVFLATIVAMFFFDFVGYVVLISMGITCAYWIYQATVLYKPNSNEFNDEIWGKKLFITSIIAITIFSLVISLDFLLI